MRNEIWTVEDRRVRGGDSIQLKVEGEGAGGRAGEVGEQGESYVDGGQEIGTMFLSGFSFFFYYTQCNDVLRIWTSASISTGSSPESPWARLRLMDYQIR